MTAEPETLEVVQFSKARFEKNELILDDDLTRDEWRDVGLRLKEVTGRVQFWIGDWARFGDKKGFTGKYTDPKVYDELEEITGLKRKTLQNYKQIAEATSSRRREDLDFSHHAEVASLLPAEQTKFLRIAAEQDLSVKDLRKKIGANDHEVLRDIEIRLAQRKELKKTFTKEEVRELDERVKELLAEVNALPLFWRIKFKQGIRRGK